ncbi:phosphotransferase [Terrabacter sp. Ter38]|uniref:phosphotransferase n=1 Tax=Terrabacter sp. Ter38 TaxID=2926030 RepID=UPI0021194537|nr:phosphotransferase [Terrabacter sp. Ter38]
MADDEVVALYDEAGQVSGSSPRSVMRARNLRHAASSIVVRDSLGRVYLHRRTTTKDVYPGLLDLAAGGVVLAGEDPAVGAVREVDEELGVAGVPLQPLGVADYADEHTRYRAFRFVVTWDGPIRWQPEEVSWGEWVTVEELVRRFDDEADSIVPDSVAVWSSLVRGWHADRVPLRQGWDSVATLVEQRWVDRTARRPEVETALLAEAVLLPAIADGLPVEVPRPVVLDRAPLRLRHALVAGEAVDPTRLTSADGEVFAAFLEVLHATPLPLAADAGCPSAADDHVERTVRVERLGLVVLPLLPPEHRSTAEALLERVATVGEQALCHGDLVTEHVLARDGRLSGVIDWGDARVTDPAVDLAWALNATSVAFADAVASGVDDDTRARARAWWALAPWFDAHHDVAYPETVDVDPSPALAHDLEVVVSRLLWWRGA